MHCTNCGTAIVADARFCPGCGTQTAVRTNAAASRAGSIVSSSATKSGGCVGLLVIVGALYAVATCSSHQSAASDDAGRPTIHTTPAELWQAYDANEAAAQARFGDKNLVLLATVEGVNLDILDEPFILLKTPNEFQSAQAKLTPATKAKAASLAKGQKIVLHCASVSEVIGTPMLGDCSF